MSTFDRLCAGQLAGSRRLDLSCGLTEFPREIFGLADSLEVLNLSGNALCELPDDLDRLTSLRILFCSDNQFTELPEVLGRCRQLDMIGFKANRIASVPDAALSPSLRWLILTDNRIDALPPGIGRCTHMQKLMLAGNRLEVLPDELAACRGLELLRISANRIEALPDWLPDLPRLAWLAFAGNPLDAAREASMLASRSTPAIEWQRLSIEHQLGEGASGVIHRALWRREDGQAQPVAVKLFKGAVTSDGWPRSEMAACIAAGTHPHLIAVLGHVEGHPEGTAGLVLELVDPAFRNLAGPPSLQSCTRDVYADDASWSVDTAWRMAHGVASAVAQLHAKGIVHGDIYAHNILSNGQGDCLLGDFGAASLLPQSDAAQALALQRIEARAFGCLVEELLAHCEVAAEADRPAFESLRDLSQRCLASDLASRPAFAEIASVLNGTVGRHG